MGLVSQTLSTPFLQSLLLQLRSVLVIKNSRNIFSVTLHQISFSSSSEQQNNSSVKGVYYSLSHTSYLLLLNQIFFHELSTNPDLYNLFCERFWIPALSRPRVSNSIAYLSIVLISSTSFCFGFFLSVFQRATW